MKVKEIVSPEGRYWPGAGPDGGDVVMITGKAYPETILRPDFLARCLEDGLVVHVVEESKKASAAKPAEGDKE